MLAPSPAAAEPLTRWPTWPTEVERIATAFIRDMAGKPIANERERLAAVHELDRLATGAILGPLLTALDDLSPQVRREALRMCFEREVVACIPSAANLWSDGGEPTVRVAALKVLALDPDPSRAAIIIEALRDPSEIIRAQAADFLGSAPMPPDVRKRARTALLSKLADVSVVVRRRAVLSLGLLGPGEGTLSIARLLEDPEPSVQASAAEALGHWRDPTAVPALRRALGLPHEPPVAQAIVEALAVLPDDSVEDDLLVLLDDPLPGLDETRVAMAIGRRPEPSDAIVSGLIARLDEPARREAALLALLLLGEDARAGLEAARARGLAPAIDTEVQRLLGALEPSVVSTSTETWPSPEDRSAWRARLDHGDDYGRRQAAWTLATLDPDWRVPAALAALAAPGPLVGRWPWALVLAASPSSWSSEHDTTARARLEGWAREASASPSERCLALAALGAAAPEHGRRSEPPWADLAEDPEPRVRACVALALGRQGEPSRLAGLLVDDRARVRASAALGLSQVDPKRIHRATRARLQLLASTDPESAVRAAATHALAVSAEPIDARSTAPGWFLRRIEPYPWRDPPLWIEVEVEASATAPRSRRLWVPAEGSGPWRWALVPGLHQARTADTRASEIALQDPMADL
ncbi:HEAT repeat domain-containing protein [Paraliomyxa miuraensis]|uniref:HEAT repeat domain-containing protein n=1 Tax=Paraliomyxa miuraensis TaxID=376150 RepID=UPI00225B5924|nr:HEAT repeat domain-containing protein [Paraliomyxa miuraensis]